MNDLFPMFGLMVLILFPVMIILAKRQSRKMGNVKCRRCHFIGPIKGVFVPFRGNKLVCRKCGSEEWERIEGK